MCGLGRLKTVSLVFCRFMTRRVSDSVVAVLCKTTRCEVHDIWPSKQFEDNMAICWLITYADGSRVNIAIIRIIL